MKRNLPSKYPSSCILSLVMFFHALQEQPHVQCIAVIQFRGQISIQSKLLQDLKVRIGLLCKGSLGITTPVHFEACEGRSLVLSPSCSALPGTESLQISLSDPLYSVMLHLQCSTSFAVCLR